MPAELALLHTQEPAPAAIREAFGQVCPGGTALEFRGGQITALLDEIGGHVMTVFPTVPIATDRASMTRDVGLEPPVPADARFWTEITIPLGDDGARERTARRVAELTNGRLHRRTGRGTDV